MPSCSLFLNYKCSMLSHMNEVDPFISAGFCMRCKNMFFQHKHAPMLHRDKRNTQKSLVQGKKIPTNCRKDKSANFELAHDCIKSFKSGAYLHTVEVKNMLSGNPKVGSSMKERFIHFDLVIWKDARETERNESLFETRVELPDPCRLLKERILPLKSLKKYFLSLKYVR